MKTIIVALLSLTLSGCATGQYRDRHFSYSTIEAPVVNVSIQTETIVEPQYETVPEVQCRTVWYGEPYYERRDRSSRTGDALAGAIIGGAIGRQFGDGSGRDAATVLGAIVGSQIATDRGRDYDRGYYRPRSHREHCYTVNVSRYVGSTSRLVHTYRTEYQYSGQIFVAHLSYMPGSTILIRVSSQGIVLGPLNY